MRADRERRRRIPAFRYRGRDARSVRAHRRRRRTHPDEFLFGTLPRVRAYSGPEWTSAEREHVAPAAEVAGRASLESRHTIARVSRHTKTRRRPGGPPALPQPHPVG